MKSNFGKTSFPGILLVSGICLCLWAGISDRVWAGPVTNGANPSEYWAQNTTVWPVGSDPAEGFLGSETSWFDVLSFSETNPVSVSALSREYAAAYLNVMNGVPVAEEVERAMGTAVATLISGSDAVDAATVEILVAFNHGLNRPTTSRSMEQGEGTVLEGAFPDPFNPSTTIRFRLADAGPVTLSVYDMAGRKVAVLIDGSLEAGAHQAAFDASTLPSGAYIYQLVTPGFTQASPMLLVK